MCIGKLAILSLFLGVESAVQKTQESVLAHPARFVTYHKTGSVLAQSVLRSCLPDADIDLNIHGEFSATMPVLHFVRDPAAIVRSAYDYHLQSTEPWLFEPAHHYHVVKNDAKLLEWYNETESYQEYLTKVPLWVGVRAEFIRCTAEIDAMFVNTKKCFRNTTECKQVCLEDFTSSSHKYLMTWRSVLDFLGLDRSSMECIGGFDMLNPSYRGSQTHSTTKKDLEASKIYEWFADLDLEFKGGAYREGSELLGCAPVSFRASSHLDDVHMEVEDAYA